MEKSAFILWLSRGITTKITLGEPNEIRDRCVKSVSTQSFYGSYFPAYGLNKRDTSYLFVFSLNAEKYGPEKISK